MDGYFVAQGLQAHRIAVGRDLRGMHLRPHKGRTPAAVRRAVIVRSQQRENERHPLTSAPGFAPAFHHSGLQQVIAGLADIGAALIPQKTFGGITGNRRDAAVPDGRHAVGPETRLLTKRLDLRQRFARYTGLLHAFHGHPRLDAAAAPGVDHDADGDSQVAGKPLGKEISHGGSLGTDLRIGPFPAVFDICLHHMRRIGLHVEKTDAVCIFSGLEQLLAKAVDLLETETAHRHFHVGLAAADPHLAQRDVGNRQLFLAAGNGQRERYAGGGCGQGHPPGAVVSHPGTDLGTPGAFHGHGLAGRTPAPYRSGGLLLQDHMVGKEMRQAQGLCRKQDRRAQQGKEQDEFLHFISGWRR